MKKLIGLGFLALALSLPLSAMAQDTPKAQKRENVQYYRAEFVKFKPGMADQAWNAIYQHFVNVDKKMGRKVRAYDLQTGDWDMVVFFPIDGPDTFSWGLDPVEEKWWKTFAELEGGAEAAKKIMDNYQSAVATTKTELGHRHLDIDQ